MLAYDRTRSRVTLTVARQLCRTVSTPWTLRPSVAPAAGPGRFSRCISRAMVLGENQTGNGLAIELTQDETVIVEINSGNVNVAGGVLLRLTKRRVSFVTLTNFPKISNRQWFMEKLTDRIQFMCGKKTTFRLSNEQIIGSDYWNRLTVQDSQ